MFFNRSNNSVIALGAGLCAAIMTIAFFASVRASDRRTLAYELAAAKNPVPVVVAKRNIGAGTLIGRGDVAYKKIPKAYLPEDFISREARIIGRETVSEIFAGEVIVDKRVSGNDSRRASNAIGPGKVALAIGTDEEAGVAGGVRAGDRVDAFVTDEENGQTRLLLRNVRALGVGGIYPYSSHEPPDKKTDLSQTSVGAMTVVLEVTSTQAAKLTQASETGKVRLALRATDYGDGR